MLALGLPSEWESREKGDAGEEGILEEARVSNPSLSVSFCCAVLKNASFMVSRPLKLNLQHRVAFPNLSLSLWPGIQAVPKVAPPPPPTGSHLEGDPTEQSQGL